MARAVLKVDEIAAMITARNAQYKNLRNAGVNTTFFWVPVVTGYPSSSPHVRGTLL